MARGKESGGSFRVLLIAASITTQSGVKVHCVASILRVRLPL